jgi:hypothetical protein
MTHIVPSARLSAIDPEPASGRSIELGSADGEVEAGDVAVDVALGAGVDDATAGGEDGFGFGEQAATMTTAASRNAAGRTERAQTLASITSRYAPQAASDPLADRVTRGRPQVSRYHRCHARADSARGGGRS